jgi:hypothetical protein
MSRTITLYSATSGLNNKLDQQRLQAGQDGIIELATAIDVSIDERGMISSRFGYAQLDSSEYHSLYSNDACDCFVIQERASDAALMQVTSLLPFTTVGIRSGLTQDSPMSFGSPGNGIVYYSNGIENGIIRSGVSQAWAAEVYYGPADDIYRFETTVPAGNIVAFKDGGLVYIADGNTVWINHQPYSYGLFNKRSGFVQLPTNITMICPVETGVFISDEKSIYYFAGTSWYDFRQAKITNYPAIKGSLAHDEIDLNNINPELQGVGRVFATTNGVCVCAKDGAFMNLTKDRYQYDSTGKTSGSCLITEESIIHA